MKRFFVALVCCLLFITLGSSVSARAEMESEVSDKAVEIASNKLVEDVLNDDSEVKWYKYKVAETGSQQFFFKSSGIGRNNRFSFRVYYSDEDGVLQEIYRDALGDGAEGHLTREYSFEEGTVLYIRIANGWDAKGYTYSLSVNTSTEALKNCVWAEKDANSEKAANPLSSANRICSILNTEKDQDWYKYEVKNNKPFSFYFKSTGIGRSNRFKVAVYYEDKDGVFQQVINDVIGDGADGHTTKELSFDKGTKVYVLVANGYDANGYRYILAVNDTIDHSSEAKIAKVEEPISILAGTNVVVGKAEPGATVSVKYGKKTYKAVADDNGYYRVKTAKLSSGKTAQIWQTVGKKSSDKVKVKVVKTY